MKKEKGKVRKKSKFSSSIFLTIGASLLLSALFLFLLLSSIGVGPSEIKKVKKSIVVAPGETVDLENIDFLRDEFKKKDNDLILLGLGMEEGSLESINLPFTNNNDEPIFLYPIVKDANDLFYAENGVNKNFSIIAVKDEWKGKFKYLSLPETLVVIYPRAFKDENFEKVVFRGKSRLNKVLYRAFENNKLGSFIFPASVNVLESSVFSGVTSLTEVSFALGNKMKVIPASTFNGSKIDSLIIPSKCQKIEGKFESNSISSVSFAENSSFKVVASEVFSNTSIKKITIPKSVIEIENEAFKGCRSLNKVIFEEDSKLKRIGYEAFSETALSSIIIPRNVKALGKNVFIGSPSLKEIIFEDGSKLKELKGGVINSNSLEIITLPSSLTYIETTAFSRSSNLEKIIFPINSEISHLTQDSFSSLENLNEIIIPPSVRYIGKECFLNLSKLEKVEFIGKSKLRVIGRDSFKGTNIKEITIPNSVIEIENGSFSSTPLEVINIESKSKLKKIGERAFSGTKLKIFNVPHSLEAISEEAFSGSSVFVMKDAFNSSLKYIGARAFANSNLQVLNVPKSIKEIGDDAFLNTPMMVLKIDKEKGLIKEKNWGLEIEPTYLER